MDGSGKANQEIIDGICAYSKEKQVKEILQEYLKRLILDQPADPVEYLIKSIEAKPHVTANSGV